MELSLENLKKLKKAKKNAMITPHLKDFGKWLGENNFGRNSFGVWSTNCSSFKRMDDDEIVSMYLNNPNELQEHLKMVRQNILNTLPVS